jgi:hypothetical protein
MSEAVVMFRSSSSGGTLYTVRDAWRQGKPVYTDQGSEAGKILLEEPELKLPGLLKQFQLKKSEQEQLSDQPLAKHVSELIENLLN